jgi:two-component system chemotaxis sensor kinase CheA
VADADVDLEAVLQIFLAESEEGLAAMEEALVALESRPDDTELLGTVFRIAHTLKGNSAALGFERLVRFSHALEGLLDRVRARAVRFDRDLVTLLLQAVDVLREMVPSEAEGTGSAIPRQEPVLQALLDRAEGPGAPDQSRAVPSGQAAPSPRGPDRRGLRVDADTLDRLLDLTGESAIARGRMRRTVQDGDAAAVLEALDEVDRLSLDLQELVMKTRLVPLRGAFRNCARAVRDLADSQAKRVRLVIEGEDVEVDTSVIDHVHDPLLHMIRNALDHGIESPSARQAAGKDACGTLRLAARREAGTIVVEVADDGAGLDHAKIRERARARGLDVDRLGPDDVERLVFEPGFSTAETVTELSGRGIGLDVVRRNVVALRGSVAIRSQEGKGTTVTLRLPLTLAIIDGFGVGVGGDTYVIPLDAVVGCLELPEARPAGPDRGLIDVRGSTLPFLRLREYFGLGGADAPRPHVVVVRRAGGEQAGLAVDELHGEFQTVVKPLGRTFKRLRGIAGSAILGTGRVALILDVPALLGEVLGQGERAREEER